jgi:hypothetical protein
MQQQLSWLISRGVSAYDFGRPLIDAAHQRAVVPIGHAA